MNEEFDPLNGPATIPEQLAASVLAFGDSIFLATEDGRSITFAETAAMADRAARAFMAAGVMPGDRVALWAPNGAGWVIACLGLQSAGGVLVPLNTRYKGGEAASILERSRARILCTVGQFLDIDYTELLGQARGPKVGSRPFDQLPDLERVVFLDETSRSNGQAWSDFLSQGDAVGPDAIAGRMKSIGSDSLCDILYTSGTTGQPKGAMHGHRQALGAARLWNWVNRLVEGDRMLIVNPFFHSFGYRAGWVSCLVAGMTAYPVSTFSTVRVLDILARERITFLPGPPTLFHSILDEPTRHAYDLSNLRIGATGSSNIPVDLISRCRGELGLKMLLTSYGLTEASAMATSCRFGDDHETIANTVGCAFPGVELAIFDSSGKPLPVGERGEVALRGFNVMQGYFEDAAATAAAIDKDGWLHTGDVGVLNDRGYLRIVDRLKDMIIVGGFNVYAAEVEALLRDAPGVSEIAVVGMPDARMGEVCAAYVVAKDGATVDEELLTRWCRSRMANFKVPRRFFRIDSIPRSPLGKPQKFKLKQIAAEVPGS